MAPTLDERATWCGDALISRVRERPYIERMVRHYSGVMQADGPRYGLVERHHDADDRVRMAFEWTCYAGVLLMTSQAPRRITVRRGLLFKPVPDVEGVRAFNARFVSRLAEQFPSEGVRAVVPAEADPSQPPGKAAFTWGLGDALAPERRIEGYLRCKDTRDQFDAYTSHMALALDPASYGTSKMIAAAHAKTIATLAEEVVRTVFASGGK